ncbi:MAG TPA: glycosyltransferase family 2 protein [Leucothrix sp.]|nr:glycosyltransferase family 2 protein [Leucothrix sp.]HIQ14532.1 glycosyltransferase family 2 protein [Leucothrix sp.]
MSQLDIVLVSYNTAEYTKRAIESVFDETSSTDFKIIMVDNDSKDNSVKLISNSFPDVEIIQTGENLGFAKGVNIGTKASDSEYILLLNPDTVILDGAIDKLMAFSQRTPQAGIWGGVTLNNDLSLNPNNARARLSFKTLLFSALGLSKVFNNSCFFNHDNYGCWDRNSEREVDVITGCFFLTPRKLWEELEGLDETFFMYAEEADYCIRAIKKGYQPRVTPDARIIHHGGVSETNISGKMLKLLKGKAELINKHAESWQKPIHKALLLWHVFNKTMALNLFSLVKKSKIPVRDQWRIVLNQRSQWLKGYQD